MKNLISQQTLRELEKIKEKQDKMTRTILENRDINMEKLDADYLAHNPKVAGAIPASATKFGIA